MCLLLRVVPAFAVHARSPVARFSVTRRTAQARPENEWVSNDGPGLAPCPIVLAGSPSRYALGADERSGHTARQLMACQSEPVRRGPHQRTLPPPSSACPPSRLVKFSRDERPEGSQPACRGDDVVWRLNLYPSRLPDGLRFLPPPLPVSPSVGLAIFLPPRRDRRRVYHVPSLYREWVRSCLSAGGSSSACGESSEFREPGPYLLAQACQPLWLSSITAFNSTSPQLTVPLDPGSRPP